MGNDSFSSSNEKSFLSNLCLTQFLSTSILFCSRRVVVRAVRNTAFPDEVTSVVLARNRIAAGYREQGDDDGGEDGGDAGEEEGDVDLRHETVFRYDC